MRETIKRSDKLRETGHPAPFEAKAIPVPGAVIEAVKETQTKMETAPLTRF